MKKVILNSLGQAIKLSSMEAHISNALEKKIMNDLGFKIDITSLTSILKRTSEAKYFKIPFADYVPTVVGEGSWSSDLVKYTSFALGEDFEQGFLNNAVGNSKMAMADAGISSVTVPVMNWAKGINWNIMQLKEASKSGNWDLVTAKEKARATNYQLGIQKLAFLGSGTAKGLLNQSGVNINTTALTKSLKTMTATELNTFLGVILSLYRTNCNYTTMPTHFAIPESDYLGLATASSVDFPLKSKIQLMQETLATMTMNPNFKILPCAYAETVNSDLAKQRYTLYNFDEDSIVFNIPVAYTATLAQSLDGFNFNNVAYSQVCGVMTLRPLETLYFDIQ